jgi:CRISPR system Cascade subunit CasB
MTQIKPKELSEPIKKFVQNLANLDAGDRARLKRNAGNRFDEANRVMGLFYNKVLPYSNVGDWAEDRYFLVATLYPLLEKSQDKNAPATVTPAPADFGLSLRRIRNADNETGLDRRLERLLDADEQQLAFQLRQAVHFLASNRGRVDWGHLLDDLLNWSHPNKRVQKKWARSYFGKELPAAVSPRPDDASARVEG